MTTQNNKHSKYNELGELLNDFGLRAHLTRQGMIELEALITTLINKEKAQAELVGRIDELKRLPNTKPVWFDPKIHTNYIQDRLAQLEAQLASEDKRG